MIKTLLLSLLLITPAYADLDKAVELAEQGKVKEGQLELIKIVKAADAGDPKSQMEFGLMWDRGYWLWQDNERAVKWWRKSAEQGYTQAQILLGTVYLGGVKADKDLEEAEKWFNKAIESDKRFSPTTRYHDYAISENLFHWQSQNSTRPDKGKGLSYVTHKEKEKTIVLFVREQSNDKYGRAMGFVNLGVVSLQDHHGSQPMNITWKLEKPLPSFLWKEPAKLAAG